jgi:sulfatase maturation enzyme AslB (radical SAM superfamily)
MFDVLKDKKIVLFGTGENSLKTLKCMVDNGLEVSYFIDNNPKVNKIEFKNHSYLLKSVEELYIEDKADLKILITPDGPLYKEIEAQLQIMGLGECIFSMYITACEQLVQYTLGFYGGNIRPCCRSTNGFNNNGAPSLEYGDSPAETAKTYIKKIETILYELNNDVEIDAANSCINCVSLKKYKYYGSGKVSKISYNQSPVPCQCKCIYCTVNKDPKNSYENSKKHNLSKKSTEMVAYLREKSLLEDYCFFSVCSGEITINPWKDLIIESLYGYRAWFYTNAIIYDAQIANSMKKDGSSINVSIDSGTRETFRFVKGVDMFHKVIENLMKYRESGDIVIKYNILPGINDREEDFNGVIKILNNLDLKNLWLSFEYKTPFRSSFFPLITLIKKLHSAGLMFNIHTFYDNEKIKRFDEMYESYEAEIKEEYERSYNDISRLCAENRSEFELDFQKYRKYIFSFEIKKLINHFKIGTRFALLGHTAKDRYVIDVFQELGISLETPDSSYIESYEKTKDTADIFIMRNKEEFSSVESYLRSKYGLSGRVLDIGGYCFSPEPTKVFLERSIDKQFLTHREI